jgi:hypothetical protein
VKAQRRTPVPALSAALALGLCACAQDPITTCESKDNARPVCGFQRPEDVDTLPGGRFLIVSQMGNLETVAPGTLALFDRANDSITVLYPTPDAAAAVTQGWGDPACPGPPEVFAPHGISVIVRSDGKSQLLVVNHGREAVEFFEVIEHEPLPLVAWRGCAVPSDLFMNDVAALPDGGFVVSHMYPKTNPTWHGLKGLLGFETGYAAQWHEGAGFEKIPGTDARMPNGIAVSADGEQVFLNVYLGSEVWKLDRTTGEMLGRAEVTHPDNSQWTAEGTLLIASHDASVPTVLACNDIETGACGARYSIVELDPAAMTLRKLYGNEGAPMGAGTAAVRVGDELVVGSFAGDRIVRVTLGQ